MTVPNVIIMRGIPGSGKSSWANTKQRVDLKDSIKSTCICSADDYHMVNGAYKFDPKNIGATHDACLRKFLEALDSKWNTIIVDNTNTMAWEIAPYYRLAQVYEFPVEIIRLHCDFVTACRRNVHNVPTERIWQMYVNIEREVLPAHWKERIIFSYQ